MGCLHHWSCLGKGFVNVNDIQTTHLWALLFCVYRRGKGEGGSGDDDGYVDTASCHATLHVCCSAVCPTHQTQTGISAWKECKSVVPTPNRRMYAQVYTHMYIQHKVYIAELIADCDNQEFVTHDPSLTGLPPFS